VGLRVEGLLVSIRISGCRLFEARLRHSRLSAARLSYFVQEITAELGYHAGLGVARICSGFGCDRTHIPTVDRDEIKYSGKFEGELGIVGELIDRNSQKALCRIDQAWLDTVGGRRQRPLKIAPCALPRVCRTSSSKAGTSDGINMSAPFPI
jgi:hypothetical protein